MGLEVYKVETGKDVWYHIVDPNDLDRRPLVLFIGYRRSLRAGLSARDCVRLHTKTSFLEILVRTGITKEFLTERFINAELPGTTSIQL